MNTSQRIISGSIVFLSLLASGCGPGQLFGPTVTSTPTLTPANTSTPSLTPTLTSTSTPSSTPTEAPTPTETPAPVLDLFGDWSGTIAQGLPLSFRVRGDTMLVTSFKIDEFTVLLNSVVACGGILFFGEPIGAPIENNKFTVRVELPPSGFPPAFTTVIIEGVFSSATSAVGTFEVSCREPTTWTASKQ